MGPRYGRPSQPPKIKPKSIKEIPAYLREVFGGFFSRLFYIIKLVWETNPLILMVMLLGCVIDGVLPIVGAYLSKDLMNEISGLMHSEFALSALAIGEAPIKNIWDAAFQGVIFFLIWYFVYEFIKRIFGKVMNGVNAIAGELVSNHIKLKIVNKAKTVNVASFDRPLYYEKLENVNREAGMRTHSII
ncbi:MAG: hypothetical protein MJ078_05215, partial [Clostridia bacterium]|nr:hypothetical protein [Clostridia bacterium]